MTSVQFRFYPIPHGFIRMTSVQFRFCLVPHGLHCWEPCSDEGVPALHLSQDVLPISPIHSAAEELILPQLSSSILKSTKLLLVLTYCEGK